jgi:hypothetical protein
MRFRQSREDLDAAAITRVVDDPAAESDRPEIRRLVAAERRVSDQLRAGGPNPPDRLVSSVEARVREAYGPDGLSSWSAAPDGGASAPRRKWLPMAAVAGLAAVCAAIVIATVGTGGNNSSNPSIPAAAALAFSSSTGPAPAAKSATLLDVAYGGVTYPNYRKFSVPPTGRRTDSIGGRPALTVFYRLPNGTPLSYTVFSGKAVPLPSGVRNVVFEGVPLRLFRTSSGLSVVTLVRYGRTCVLAAKTRPDVVLGLAAAPVLAQRQA